MALKTSKSHSLVKNTTLLVLFGMVASLGACNHQGDSFDAETDSGVLLQEIVGDNISELELSSNSTSEITFTDYDDDDQFVLVLYNQNSESTKQAFELAGDSSAPVASLVNATGQNTDAVPASDLTDTWHEMLRQEEARLDPDTLAQKNRTSFLTDTDEIGSSREFRVLDAFSNAASYTTITTQLVYTDAGMNYYVDTRDLASVDTDDIVEVAGRFSGVRENEENLFGTPSDVDGDGKVNVVFSRTVNELGASGGGFISGFVYAGDLHARLDYPASNESEVIYTFVPDPEGILGSPISKNFAMSNVWPGVIAHEYQHIINYHHHVFINEGQMEASFLNEGLSHLAEDIYSINEDGYMEYSGIENPVRVRYYLENAPNTCFTCGSTLAQRGGAYLFLRYLYEQAEKNNLASIASGAELISALIDTDATGVENIVTAVFGENAAIAEFKKLLAPFSVAVYLSGSGAENTSSLMQFDGIDLRDVQDDNRGTTLNGPALTQVSSLPHVDTIQGNGVNYLLVTGETIRNSGGKITLGFSSGSDFGGYIIAP